MHFITIRTASRWRQSQRTPTEEEGVLEHVVDTALAERRVDGCKCTRELLD